MAGPGHPRLRHDRVGHPRFAGRTHRGYGEGLAGPERAGPSAPGCRPSGPLRSLPAVGNLRAGASRKRRESQCRTPSKGKQAARRERVAAARARQKRAERRRNLITTGWPRASDNDPAAQALAHAHVARPVTYSGTPPVGGRHNATWMNCGIYDQPVPNERAVHNMEHGAIWITYQPSLPQAQVS
ncbi:MAG TPA: DUF3105 domain-containing protein [Streptosporangiaceae bacterium]|nr:DUF3105 domain-containing protein [Streptosporangiaceae bacterium]